MGGYVYAKLPDQIMVIIVDIIVDYINNLYKSAIHLSFGSPQLGRVFPPLRICGCRKKCDDSKEGNEGDGQANGGGGDGRPGC
jgi:hypothetical protein